MTENRFEKWDTNIWSWRMTEAFCNLMETSGNNLYIISINILNHVLKANELLLNLNVYTKFNSMRWDSVWGSVVVKEWKMKKTFKNKILSKTLSHWSIK